MGEAITAFMRYPGDQEGIYHGPFPSGAPLIFASAAARLGLGVDLAAGFGDDDFGALMRDRLLDHGVSPDLLVQDPAQPTAVVFVSYLENGARTFAFYVEGTAAQQVPVDVLDRLATTPAWVHVSGSALAFGGPTGEAAWASVNLAVEHAIPLSLDPNLRTEVPLGDSFERIATALEHASVVFASEGELEPLAAEATAIGARGAVLVEKLGARGARVTTVEGTVSIPALPVTEVDPDGAGDIFAAAYVAAALHGEPPVAAARVGCLVAGRSVCVRGPLESPIEPLAAYLRR